MHRFFLHHVHAIFLTLLAVSFILPAARVDAANVFMVQLGLYGSRGEADEAHLEVTQQYPELSEYRYQPKQGRQLGGGEPPWRLLVGPFEDRRSANKTCASVSASGQNCFIVESAAAQVESAQPSSSAFDIFGASEPVAPVPSVSAPIPSPTVIIPSPDVTPSIASGGEEEDNTSSWNIFGRDSGDSSDDEPATQNEIDEITQQKTSADSSATQKPININTKSVYQQGKVNAPAQTGNLFDSITGLFESDEPDIALSQTEDVVQPDVQTAVEPVISSPWEANSAPSFEPSQEPPLPPTPTPETVQSQIVELKPIESKSASVEGGGRVEVFEAIPVISGQDSPIVTPMEQVAAPFSPEPIASTPEVEPALVTPAAPVVAQTQVQEKRIPLTQYRGGNTVTRSIQISIFANEAAAFSCLSRLRDQMPLVSSLRTRIVKSQALTRHQAKALLKLGPVGNDAAGRAVCAQTVVCGAGLSCRVIAERGATTPAMRRDIIQANTPNRRSSKNSVLRDLTRRSDGRTRTTTSTAVPQGRYGERRTKRPASISVPTRSRASRRVAGAGTQNWVQLGLAPNPQMARERYNQLASSHSDLLGGKRLHITAATSRLGGRGSAHRIRIGPFNDRGEASSLCRNLGSRGVGCLVLTD